MNDKNTSPKPENKPKQESVEGSQFRTGMIYMGSLPGCGKSLLAKKAMEATKKSPDEC